jgi:hypothetical protein
MGLCLILIKLKVWRNELLILHGHVFVVVCEQLVTAGYLRGSLFLGHFDVIELLRQILEWIWSREHSISSCR